MKEFKSRHLFTNEANCSHICQIIAVVFPPPNQHKLTCTGQSLLAASRPCPWVNLSASQRTEGSGWCAYRQAHTQTQTHKTYLHIRVSRAMVSRANVLISQHTHKHTYTQLIHKHLHTDLFVNFLQNRHPVCPSVGRLFRRFGCQ